MYGAPRRFSEEHPCSPRGSERNRTRGGGGKCRFPCMDSENPSWAEGLARTFWEGRSQQWLDSGRRRRGGRRGLGRLGSGDPDLPIPPPPLPPGRPSDSISSPANTYHLKPSPLCLPNISSIFDSARRSFLLSSACLSATCHNL